MDNTTAVMDAVKDGKWDDIRGMIEAEPALAATRDAAGVSLVMMLAYRGHADLAAFVASHTQTDIFEATVIGDQHRLQEILQQTPVAVNSQSADGWTPLHLAGFFGKLESAKLLLAHGADVAALGNNYMRNMPLHAALSGQQNIDLLALLLQHGAVVNAAAATNITPLHLAASRGNQTAIDMLLAKGANKAAKMDNGQTPSDLARERGFPAVANALA